MASPAKFIDIDAPDWEPLKLSDVGLAGVSDALPGRAHFLQKYTDGPLDSKPDTRLSTGLVEGPVADAFEYVFPHDELWLLLEGEGHIEIDDGDVIEMRPNRLIWLPKGLKTKWTYTSPYKGVFVHLW